MVVLIKCNISKHFNAIYHLKVSLFILIKQVELRETSVREPVDPIEHSINRSNGGDLGVWAVETIPEGTKFGPFLGKWCLEPANPQYAWEVSYKPVCCFVLCLC